MSFQIFVYRRNKEKDRKKKKENEEKEILMFTIMNIKIMIEKSFTYACVSSNKFRMLR
jgi:hypothetical protein